MGRAERNPSLPLNTIDGYREAIPILQNYEYPEANPLTKAEQAEFDAIRDRLWYSWLPPVEAVRELTRAAVALPDENDAAWKVLEACGISRGVSGLLS